MESKDQKIKHNILVMEDDPTIGSMLKSALEEKGYEVNHFSDGALAAQWLTDHSPDLALLDLHVPNQSGFEVMKAIRKKDQNSGTYIPVIVLTGVYTSRNDKVSALDMGADDFLPKPFDLYELLARVRSLLRVQELYKRSQYLATHDPLTGCYNRRYLMDFLSREFERFNRYKSPLSFIMMDMDGFKTINDRHGHEAGDKSLLFFSSCLHDFFRAVDCVARVGGDEFAAALPGCNSEEAKGVAARLIEFVKSPERIKMLPDELRGKIHFSLGLASLPEHTRDVQQLLKLADEALYAAKRCGQDQFRMSA